MTHYYDILLWKYVPILKEWQIRFQNFVIFHQTSYKNLKYLTKIDIDYQTNGIIDEIISNIHSNNSTQPNIMSRNIPCYIGNISSKYK